MLPGTAVGVGSYSLLPFVEDVLPSSLAPQQYAFPEMVSPQVVAEFAATALKGILPIGVGSPTGVWLALPLPTCPYWFRPQQYTWSELVIPQVVPELPTETVLNL